MKLVNYLSERCILVGLDVSTKKDAMSAMVDALLAEHDIALAKADIMRALDEREALGGTDFPNGVSIPHAKFDDFPDIALAFAIPRKPIPASDGAPIRLLCLILAQRMKTTLYVNLLAAVARAAGDEALLQRLTAARSASEFLHACGKSGIEVSRGLTARDIMTADVVAATPSMMLKELLDILYKRNLSYVPVVDAERRLIAEVTLLDIIGKGLPNYASMLTSMGFLSSFEPFDELLRHESTLSVADVMRPPAVHLSPDASIIQVAFEMHQRRLRHVPITKDGKLAGVVSIIDIIRKILRS